MQGCYLLCVVLRIQFGLMTMRECEIKGGERCATRVISERQQHCGGKVQACGGMFHLIGRLAVTRDVSFFFCRCRPGLAPPPTRTKQSNVRLTPDVTRGATIHSLRFPSLPFLNTHTHTRTQLCETSTLNRALNLPNVTRYNRNNSRTVHLQTSHIRSLRYRGASLSCRVESMNCLKLSVGSDTSRESWKLREGCWRWSCVLWRMCGGMLGEGWLVRGRCEL